MVPDAFCSSTVLGAHDALRFKPATRCENACASGSAALYSALDAVQSGRIKVALVVGAEKMTGLDTAGVTKALRSEGHTSELQSLMRISYAVFCLKKKHTNNKKQNPHDITSRNT